MKKSSRIFCVRQVYFTKPCQQQLNLATCKPAIYTFYTSHPDVNSAMRRCFYSKLTYRRQNALFHNFVGQIVLIQ